MWVRTSASSNSINTWSSIWYFASHNSGSLLQCMISSKLVIGGLNVEILEHYFHHSHVVVAAVNNFMFLRPWMCWASLKIHALTEGYLIVFQTAKILTSTTLSDWNFGIKWMKSSKPWKQSCLILSIKCNTSQIFLTQSSPPLTICFTRPLSIPPSLCVSELTYLKIDKAAQSAMSVVFSVRKL